MYLAVLGVLKTKKGIDIKNEMLNWLKPKFDVLCIEQEPPGKLFEYPAILYALKLSIAMNKPVLYLHTKGAVNDTWYQKPVRMLWMHEFSTEKYNDYLNAVNNGLPSVATPISGDKGATFFNAFVINPNAAKLLLSTFHISNNRFYYEHLFDNKIFNVIGIIKDKMSHDEEENMQKNQNLFDYS